MQKQYGLNDDDPLLKLVVSDQERLKIAIGKLNDEERRVLQEAIVKLTRICDVCFNSAWAPCLEDDEGAIKTDIGFERCGYCALEREYLRLRNAVDTLADKWDVGYTNAIMGYGK